MPALIRNGMRESVHLLSASLATSLLLVLAMPGRFGWWPLLCIALVPLLVFTATKGPRKSFTAGLLAGFFCHAGLLYWIVIVLGRYGGLPISLAVPSMLLLSFYMGMYTALFACLLSLFLFRDGRDGSVSVLVVFAAPSLWVGLDWLRSFLFSGFPWMDLGYGLYTQPLLLQAADLGGHHLLTFLLVMINALLCYGVVLFFPDRRKGYLRQAGPAVAAVVILLLLAGGYSALRFQMVRQHVEEDESVQVAVVQGNIPQDEKWTPARKRSTLDIYKTLSEQAVDRSNSALVVWPETALPFFPVNDPLFASVKEWAAGRNAWLLTGAPYFELHTDLERPFSDAASYFNSALLVDGSGKVAGRYDKQHLVPFGEYVPLRKMLPFLEPLVESVGNFSFGKSSAPLSMDGVRLGVLICFESIFPDLARREVAAGANVLVNLTNDAWYGRSSAPYQSFAMTVLRAVETRRAVIRAANTGISGFVDPAGRILDRSPIFERLSMTSSVPLLRETTVFTRFGYLFAPFCLVMSALLFLARVRFK